MSDEKRDSRRELANEKPINESAPVPLSVNHGMRVANKSDPERFQSRADIVKPPSRPGGTPQK